MIKQFYADIFPQDDTNKLLWTLSDKRSHWFKDTGKMIKFIEDNPHNIFYGVGTTDKKKSKFERALSSEIASMKFFHLDIDIKSEVAHKSINLPATIAEAEEIANKFLEPTYLINSGHGLHALYLFFDHHKIDDLNYITTLSQQFQEAHRDAFPQYDIDFTHDLARVLRCPGSINSKDPDNPINCEILKYDKDAMYWIEQIEDAIEYDPDKIKESPTASISKGGKAKYAASAGGVDIKGWSTKEFLNWFDNQCLVIDKSASMDADLWVDIASADPSFIQAYNHEFDKKDKKGEVVSDKKEIDMNRYDMILANICAKYGVPDQKIVNLLVMHRRKYGVNLNKLNRKDYFARTLIKAGVHRAIGIIAKKKSQNQPISTTEQSTVQAYIDGILKCRISKLIRFGKDPNPQFELELDDLPGKTIKLGSFLEGIINQKNFRAKIGAMGITMPIAIKQDKWEKTIIPYLQILTVNGIVPTTSTYEGQIQEWITEYFIEKTILENIDVYIADELIEQPFYHNARVHFKLEALQNWIRNSKNHATDFSFVTSMIGYGFSQEIIQNTDGNRIRLWAAPVSFIKAKTKGSKK